MIPRAAIDQRVREWGLRHGVVEKDYVLGWLLWGIGRHPVLGSSWIFKGGTCLKKCYIETYRFSEDLDFTIVDGGPIDPADVTPLLAEVLDAVADASGIDFSDRQPLLRARKQQGSVEGRVYYRGPLAAPSAASVKLDLSATEPLVRASSRAGAHRSYRVDRIQTARATTAPFTPKYAVEFSSAGPLAAPRQTRRRTLDRG